jgi:hypothetical protein
MIDLKTLQKDGLYREDKPFHLLFGLLQDLTEILDNFFEILAGINVTVCFGSIKKA